MSDVAGPPADPRTVTAAGRIDCVVFALANKRFALPIDSVDSVACPPALARVPHAGPALLGAGNLGGRIVPIVDLARLLDRRGDAAAYDGSGEILRLRAAGGGVGVWVDRVEGLASVAARDELTGVEMLDPAPLLAVGLAALGLASGPQAPLGDPAERVPFAPAAPSAAYIVVEADAEPIRLRREDVVELIEAVPWTPLPRAPVGLLGIALLRGAALPILSLAVLAGLRGPGVPRAFAVIEIEGRRALIAVDRIVGLRFQRLAGGRRWATAAASDQSDGDDAPIDLAATIPAELRRVVLGFSQRDAPGAAILDGAIEYLVFTIAGQECGVPVAGVERVVDVRPAIRLPQPADAGRRAGMPQVDGAIELRGQIVPVVGLRSRLAFERDKHLAERGAPSAYVILRDAGGLLAIAADQIKQMTKVRAEEIAAPPGDGHGPIVGIAKLPNGEILQLVAPERLWARG